MRPAGARDEVVAEAGERLQEAEDPERVPESDERGGQPADERAGDGRGHPDRGQRDAAVVRGVPHVDQKGPRQRRA